MNSKLIFFFVFGFIGTSMSSMSYVKRGTEDNLKGVIDKTAGGLENLFASGDKALNILKEKSVEHIENLRKQYAQSLENVKQQTSNKQVHAKVGEQLLSAFKKNVESIRDNVEKNFHSVQNQLKPSFAKNLENYEKSMGPIARTSESVKDHLKSVVENLKAKAEGAFSERNLEGVKAELDAAVEKVVASLKSYF